MRSTILLLFAFLALVAVYSAVAEEANEESVKVDRLKRHARPSCGRRYQPYHCSRCLCCCDISCNCKVTNKGVECHCPRGTCTCYTRHRWHWHTHWCSAGNVNSHFKCCNNGCVKCSSGCKI
ncbi:hypothetical protein NP493_887g01013 [Ridgeia piscesae]|uniref:Uncharacterized protein n=1 Tax=Ridgeia piscesae TaxID=27915 RepID=A0AAD9KLA9_RIDPI|nr:hypothetical protein NP493_887g01013 [Ridgeia piscesae]